MSVLHYDKFSSSFLVGVGVHLYQYLDSEVKLLASCGDPPLTSHQKNEDVENKNKEEQSNNKEGNQTEKDDTKEKEQKAPRAEGQAFITGIATCEECIAVINNNKVVETFDRNFQKQASVVAIKRPTSVQVTNTHVVISDKSGDAYSYTLSLSDQKYLLGHVSVVMDMVITLDHKFLVTCDRDEKIRISHFPNCYNIESYLLGHEEYVFRIILLSPNLLLSVGGDQKIFVWNLSTNTLLQTLQTDDVTKTHGDVTSVSYSAPYLLISRTCHVTTYKLTDNQTLEHTSDFISDHDIMCLAASENKVLVLTKEPKLECHQFSNGVLSDKKVIEGQFDLSKCVNSTLPEKKKVVRTAGFTDYFERKRKRIEEEEKKEESRKLKVESSS